MNNMFESRGIVVVLFLVLAIFVFFTYHYYSSYNAIEVELKEVKELNENLSKALDVQELNASAAYLLLSISAEQNQGSYLEGYLDCSSQFVANGYAVNVTVYGNLLNTYVETVGAIAKGFDTLDRFETEHNQTEYANIMESLPDKKYLNNSFGIYMGKIAAYKYIYGKINDSTRIANYSMNSTS